MQRPRQSDGAGNAEHERPRAAVLPNGECQTKQGEQRKALKCIKSEAFEVSERDEPDSSNDSREERKARSPTSSCSSSGVFWALKGKGLLLLLARSQSLSAQIRGSPDTSETD